MVERSQTLLDRYRLGPVLGTGGMGSVIAAHDDVLDRPVAIKMLRDEMAGDPTVRERFRREAKIAAALRHPGICSVFDFQEADGTSFIVMELLEGETLHERVLRDGALEPREAAEIVARAADALDHAHGSGAVHRDIKPANLFITSDGDVKVTDFGIAFATTQETLTKVGDVLGTAAYLAPEQVEGGRASPASDIYSLGCVLFESLTGRPPFVAETPLAVGRAHLEEDPPDVRSIAPEVPSELGAVVSRALSKKPGRRFGSAGEMARELRGVAGFPVPVLAAGGSRPSPGVAAAPTIHGETGPPTLAESDTPEGARRLRPKPKMRSFLVVLVLAVLIGAFALLSGPLRRGSTPDPPVPDTIGLPDLRGESFGVAVARLTAMGFPEPRREDVLGTPPANTVLHQAPAPGEDVAPTTRVFLTVSNGMGVEVPKLVGLSLNDAKQTLEDVGLKEKVIDEVPGPQDDIVTAQNPEEGRVVPRETEVGLTISKKDDEDRGPPGQRNRDND